MTQIPREQSGIYQQNPTIIPQYPISNISKPESSQLAKSQAIRPTSPQFTIPQSSSIQQSQAFVPRLSHPV